MYAPVPHKQWRYKLCATSCVSGRTHPHESEGVGCVCMWSIGEAAVGSPAPSSHTVAPAQYADDSHNGHTLQQRVRGCWIEEVALLAAARRLPLWQVRGESSVSLLNRWLRSNNRPGRDPCQECRTAEV